MIKKSRDEVRNLKMKFGMWLAIPPKARDGIAVARDQADFALQIGVEPETLSRWRKDPTVQEARKNAIGVFLEGARWEILKATVEKAKSGNFQDRRLYFQLTGDIGKQPEKGDSSNEKVEVKFIIESPNNVPDKTEFRGAGEVPGESDQ